MYRDISQITEKYTNLITNEVILILSGDNPPVTTGAASLLTYRPSRGEFLELYDVLPSSPSGADRSSLYAGGERPNYRFFPCFFCLFVFLSSFYYLSGSSFSKVLFGVSFFQVWSSIVVLINPGSK